MEFSKQICAFEANTASCNMCSIYRFFAWSPPSLFSTVKPPWRWLYLLGAVDHPQPAHTLCIMRFTHGSGKWVPVLSRTAAISKMQASRRVKDHKTVDLGIKASRGVPDHYIIASRQDTYHSPVHFQRFPGHVKLPGSVLSSRTASGSSHHI